MESQGMFSINVQEKARLLQDKSLIIRMLMPLLLCFSQYKLLRHNTDKHFFLKDNIRLLEINY